MLVSNYRNILLWRHAKPLPPDDNIDLDSNRPLSKKCGEQAKKWLHGYPKTCRKRPLLFQTRRLERNKLCKR